MFLVLDDFRGFVSYKKDQSEYSLQHNMHDCKSHIEYMKS